MIERLVPDTVAVVSTREHLDVELFPDEARSVGRAVEKRRREFTTGRACARLALRRLALEPVAIPSGERGEPLWPRGVVGSITHCSGYCACAVAKAEDVAALGIDAEVHEPLPEGVLERVAFGRELAMVAGRGAGVCVDKLLFSAKEAVYKAWFPLTGRWLGFEDVELRIDLVDRVPRPLERAGRRRGRSRSCVPLRPGARSGDGGIGRNSLPTSGGCSPAGERGGP